MATNKMQRQYRVTNGYNPVTKKKILRPVITNRKKMNLDQIVEYCLNAGFVRGQFHDMRGNLNGFIEGMKQLGQDGHDLYLDDWFRIHAEFTGTVDESRTLTAKNELRVNITVLKELKRSAADFSWTNVDDNSANPKIAKVTYLGGSEDKVVDALLPIVFTGTNLTYHEGDKTTATYKDAEGLEHVIDMGAPAEFTDGHQKYEPQDEFKNLDDEAEIEFAFYTRGGIKDAPEKVSRRTATLIASKEPKMVSFTQLNAAGNVESEGLLTNLYSKLEIKAKNIPEGVKGRYAVYSKSTGTLLADTKWDPNPLDTTFERVSDTLIRAEFKRNSTVEPDGAWYEVGNPVKFELLLPDGTIIALDIPYDVH